MHIKAHLQLQFTRIYDVPITALITSYYENPAGWSAPRQSATAAKGRHTALTGKHTRPFTAHPQLGAVRPLVAHGHGTTLMVFTVLPPSVPQDPANSLLQNIMPGYVGWWETGRMGEGGGSSITCGDSVVRTHPTGRQQYIPLWW